MKKLLLGGLTMFAGIVSAPVSGSLYAESGAPNAEYRHDPRFAQLFQFFEKFNCPAKEYSAAFLAAADLNDLDWRLLPSISYLESTGGKASRNNNLFGWNSGNTKFASPVESIRTVGNRLAHSNLYRTKSLDRLLATYNPVGDYSRRVQSVMARIAPAQ